MSSTLRTVHYCSYKCTCTQLYMWVIMHYVGPSKKALLSFIDEVSVASVMLGFSYVVCCIYLYAICGLHMLYVASIYLYAVCGLYFSKAMDTGSVRVKSAKNLPPVLPEIELFVHLMILLRIFDDGELEKVWKCISLIHVSECILFLYFSLSCVALL